MLKGFLALVALMLLYLGFVVGMRYVPPSPAQQAALQLLRAPTPAVEGIDGSDAAWLLDHEVPADRHAEVARQYRDYLQKTDGGAGTPGLANPLAAWEQFAEAPPEGEGVCVLRESGCLAYVRDQRDRVEAALAEHWNGLEAALALARYDGLRYGLRPTLTQKFPPLQSQRRLVKTWFAYEFVRGQQYEAIDGLCRDLAGWRRLGGNADTLIASMVGVSYVQQDLMLLAELLGEYSISATLPASCDSALAEVADYELDLCPAMRTEFRMMDNLEQQFAARPRPDNSGLDAMLFDAANFRAAIAPGYARFCTPAPLQAARADQALAPLPKPPALCGPLRKAADPFGCALAETSWPDQFDKYADRRADQAAMLALMRTVVWLRTAVEHPEEVPAALARRPASLGLRREPAFDAGESRLSIPLLDSSRAASFTLDVRVGRPAKKRRSPVRAVSGSALAANG